MTPASFKAAFPVFDTEQDADIQRHITAALTYVDAARFGTDYDEALGYVVCHRIATEKADRADGINAKAGDVLSAAGATTAGQRSAARGPASVAIQMSDPFMRTVYGQRYRYLANLYGLGGTAA